MSEYSTWSVNITAGFYANPSDLSHRKYLGSCKYSKGFSVS